MTSLADPIAAPQLADKASVPAAAPVADAPAITLPTVGERELRLDLFRGLALWLIFVDHLPTNILTWLTIRNYGFSDATEIFIFISGYTAAFVYGRAMLEVGFVVASARILRRVWQIYVAHVFLFTIFLAEISYVATRFENPLYSRRNGHPRFPQAARCHHRAGAAAALPPRQHGRAAALHRADAVPAADPVADEMARRCHAGAVGAALRRDLAVRSLSLRLSERLLGLQPVCLAIAVRVRRLVRARRRAADVAHPVVERSRCGSASLTWHSPSSSP